MNSATVYLPESVSFTPADLDDRKEPQKVLMSSPEHFAIVDEKNLHMAGKQGTMDQALAQEQWQALKAAYEQLVDRGFLESVHVIPGAAGCEDMVFCANQTFPWPAQQGFEVVLSRMRHPSRQREVPHFEAFFLEQGYAIRQLPESIKLFEGMGDGIPHPGKKLIYGGYGHRTNLDAYHTLAETLDCPIIPLELINPAFYHLDTCFLPISEDAVLYCPEAFTAQGQQLIHRMFTHAFPIPESEAGTTLALNAHVLTHPQTAKRVAVVHPVGPAAQAAFEALDVEIIPINTSEYLKSGGSVFCMKMMFY